MLMKDVPQGARLAVMALLSTFGTITNGFFLSSFFVDPVLRRKDNVYLACLGMCEFIITSVVMATSAVVLLSGEWDTVCLCRALQILTEGAQYSYSLFSLLVAIESYNRVWRLPTHEKDLVDLRLYCIPLMTYCIGFGTAAVGVIYNYDYDYCKREFDGNWIFRLATVVILHGIPGILTINCLAVAIAGVKRRAKNAIEFRQSINYESQYSLVSINIAAFILFVLAWAPHFVVILDSQADDDEYYYTVWIGMIRSAFSSILYAFFQMDFKNAFAHLFNYCFCKNTLPGPYAERQRRASRRRSNNCELRAYMPQRFSPINRPRPN